MHTRYPEIVQGLPFLALMRLQNRIYSTYWNCGQWRGKLGFDKSLRSHAKVAGKRFLHRRLCGRDRFARAIEGKSLTISG